MQECANLPCNKILQNMPVYKLTLRQTMLPIAVGGEGSSRVVK